MAELVTESTCLRENNQRTPESESRQTCLNESGQSYLSAVSFFFLFLLIHFRRIHQFPNLFNIVSFHSFSRIIVLHYTTTIRVIVLTIRSNYRRCVCLLCTPLLSFLNPHCYVGSDILLLQLRLLSTKKLKGLKALVLCRINLKSKLKRLGKH